LGTLSRSTSNVGCKGADPPVTSGISWLIDLTKYNVVSFAWLYFVMHLIYFLFFV
jgi:hypothetical protein